MQNFHDMLADIMATGQNQFNTRTGKVCRAKVGYQLQFDMADGFPAITTKKLAVGAAKGELLGFFRGYTNAADFRALGCKIWDANANETPTWLSNPNRKGEDDLGDIYGAQWTAWKSYREVDAGDTEHEQRLLATGYERICADGNKSVWRKSINQIEDALRKIITDPSDRRIIVSGWNVGEFDRMALLPCHMDYRFTVFQGEGGRPGKLHVTMTIRSWDTFLGGPFNVVTTALFLEIMARLAGLESGTVTIQATNAHVYEDHFEQVREQLGREHFPAPRLLLGENIKPVLNVEDIPGVFARINPEDIELVGYQSHAAIKAPMAA